MKASSDIKPSGLFEIEDNGNKSTILFYPEYPDFDEVTNEEGTILYEYDLYRLEVLRRENLTERLNANYAEWLALAILQENKPKQETDKEKILRLEQENNDFKTKVAQQDFVLEEMIFEIIPSITGV